MYDAGPLKEKLEMKNFLGRFFSRLIFTQPSAQVSDLVFFLMGQHKNAKYAKLVIS